MSIRLSVLAIMEELGEATWRDAADRLPQYREKQIEDAVQGCAKFGHLELVRPSLNSGHRSGCSPAVYRATGTRPAGRWGDKPKSPPKVSRQPKKSEPLRPVASVFEMGDRAAANMPFWSRRNARQDFATPEAA